MMAYPGKGVAAARDLVIARRAAMVVLSAALLAGYGETASASGAAALPAQAAETVPALQSAVEVPAAIDSSVAAGTPEEPSGLPPRRATVPVAPWGDGGVPVQGHAAMPSYGISMPWDEESFVAYRASYLSEGGRKWLAAVLVRARPYLPYIYERIRLYGLPDELAFLPVIESEYSAKAVSRSGAAGIWQFMRNSIAGYGMRIDDWIDERRDFMKSSDGALRKLADNYAVLGDWQLAIAAYNAGLGALSRAVAKAKAAGVEKPDFWELRRRGLLRRETAAYVPKFLAVASILRYPGRYGVAATWEPAPVWETLAPGRPVDIILLAQRAGIGAELLKSANAELRYTVTPPEAGYRLKVPAQAASAIKAVLDDGSSPLFRYAIHSVRSGDTLSALSRRYGSPIATILGANPGLKADRINLGQKIVIPLLKDAPTPQAAAEGADEPAAFTGSYVVARGDTLWALSLRFDVQPELLAERNGLKLDSVIREGMTLRVPIGK